MEIARKKQRVWKMKMEELEGERLVKRVYGDWQKAQRRARKAITSTSKL